MAMEEYLKLLKGKKTTKKRDMLKIDFEDKSPPAKLHHFVY